MKNPTANNSTQTSTPSQGWILPLIVLIGVAVAIVAAFLGSGAIVGTPINQAAGGALSADSTPLAPAGPAFRIWSVIYLGLAGYAFWQLSGTARRSAREHSLRPWALLSVLLNAAWIWMVQLGLLFASVVVIVLLLAVLIKIMYLLGAPRTAGWVELILTDGTFGLYFGWVLVATFANIWAWLAALEVDLFRQVSLGVVGIIVAGVLGILIAVLDGGRVAPALATAWGLGWIAVARTEGQYEAAVLTWSAAAAALLILLATAAARFRRTTPRP
ncbi:hypothetical protein COCCU_07405 [Corynebacterium occultum]|uniref:TspO/MBR family protein n=1 Tax=Corynebacterium occultum TaxID=2675219 RepID=A0A6B8W7Z3_9CORY|nr:tryptophan-rich sensory protein [Corynebacterium occultum]QGU07415.1 hypothetical protein COCCU_07405 [Corynebacterium occultum]